jgi:anti-anti-sigma factor
LIERTHCAVRPHPDRVGVRLVGELDVSNRTVIYRVLEGFAGTASDIYFDLAGLTFIDVAGIAAFVAFAHEQRPHRVVLQHASPLVARVVPIVWPDCGLELEPAVQMPSHRFDHREYGHHEGSDEAR